MKKQLKTYIIDVIEKRRNGMSYGKEYYFKMQLLSYSKRDAKETALKNLSTMSFNTIKSLCIKNGIDDIKPREMWDQYHHEDINGKDASIGIELANVFFTFNIHIKNGELS